MRALVRAFVCVGLLGASCVSSTLEPKADDPQPSPSSERVEIPNVQDILQADKMQGCLYRKRTKPDPNAIASQGLLAWLTSQVESNRDLQLDLDLSDIELANGAEFQRMVEPRAQEAVKEQQRILKWLAWALGMSPHGIDVNAFVGGDESTLIAGFYNPKTGEVVVRSSEDVNARAIPTFAHEFAHAAADQAFGLPTSKSRGVIDDARLASRSLVEGDASLVEFRFLSRFAPDKAMTKAIKSRLGLEDRFAKERRNGVPELLIDQFVFPYQWGLAFVCAVYRDGGWKAVNRMYRHPPESSAEIMFPERFLAGESPESTEPLGKLTKPWRLHAKGSIGAAHLKALFEAPANVAKRALRKPIERAAAWAGGRYELWVSDEETIGSMGIALVEHEDQPGVLCASMRSWYEAAFPDARVSEFDEDTMTYAIEDQVALIRCVERDVRIGIAPNGDLAETLID